MLALEQCYEEMSKFQQWKQLESQSDESSSMHLFIILQHPADSFQLGTK